MRREGHDLWDKFWKDKHGNVVIWQTPNLFLIGWAILTVISLVISGKTAADVCGWIANAALIIWSLLEIVKGVNYFRRFLGLIVLILAVILVTKYF